MEDKKFWTGISLVVNGLVDASKQASYSTGFGAGGLSVSMLLLKHFGVTGVELTLISMSAFFVTARLGKAFDEIHERALLEAQLQHELKLKELKDRNNGEEIKIIKGK